jgi:nucleotide-binding universal stress UspA family protein
MKRILVGVDGSDASAAALGWAGRVAKLVGAEILVATAFEPDQAEVSPERYEDLRTEAERRLDDEWSAPVRGSGILHRSLLLAGSPEVLLTAADANDVDLVVVGPRGHSRFGRLHVGSVAHHLAHYTSRPFAIVPSPGAGARFDRIVVGLDGSEGSACAVRWCAGLARAVGAEVIAVYAFDPLVEWVEETDPRSWRQLAERELRDDWTAPLHEAGVAVRTRIVERHPVAAIAEVIEAEGAGLAVVGTRGIGGFLGLRLGRVPVQLVHHTQVPIVLVPPMDVPDSPRASGGG